MPPITDRVTPARTGRGRPNVPSYAKLLSTPVPNDLATQLHADEGGVDSRRRPGFESVEDCVYEDLRRAEQLAVCGLPGARQLANLLRESDAGFAHDTCASAVYSRQLRRVAGSQLLQLITDSSVPPSMFTVVDPSWRMPADDLQATTTVTIQRQLRAALTGPASVGPLPGEYVFGQVHGEFDSRTDQFQLHVHGLATSHFIPPLRTLAAGKSTKQVRVPVQVKTLRDQPRQVSYILQSFWPDRRSFIDDSGVIRRTRRKRRIPEPWGSQVLLWLDRQSLGSMQFKVGMTNSSSELQVRNWR